MLNLFERKITRAASCFRFLAANLAIMVGCLPAASARSPQDSAPEPAIVRLDPRFDELVASEAVLEKIADGIAWAEGPVWDRPGEFLLFSDVPNNSIFKWEPGKGLSLFLKPTGYTGTEPFQGREPGSNGLAFDKQGRLVFCQHGDRRISRLEKNGTKTVLVEKYQGKRINSPNDLVFKSNGDLYFTDPPIWSSQVVRRSKTRTRLLRRLPVLEERKADPAYKQVQAPNGIACAFPSRSLTGRSASVCRTTFCSVNPSDSGGRLVRTATKTLSPIPKA